MRNDNSSRFGKYIRIWINKNNKTISGASITNYLLEKSRVTSLSNGERTYHIFYYLVRGLKNPQDFKLTKKLESYNYVKQGNTLDIENVNDSQKFQEVFASLKSMNFNE